MPQSFRPMLLSLLMLITAPVTSEPLSQSAMLANTCAGCHGTDGNSQGPATPNISGLSEQFIMDAMEAFKEGERQSTVMNRIAKGYTEKQIELLAKYFSKLPKQWPQQTTTASLVNAGEKLHTKYCVKCHEDNGRSSDEDAGILANQKIPYLKYVLDDVLNGQREVSTKMTDKLK
ncbi:MAG: cytochrome c, partial [Gammaproteobacteria bacterium]|nr:cytochrome c [Gammaproteobacteria bacterium]